MERCPRRRDDHLAHRPRIGGAAAHRGEPQFTNNSSPAARRSRAGEIRCGRTRLTGPQAGSRTGGPAVRSRPRGLPIDRLIAEPDRLGRNGDRAALLDRSWRRRHGYSDVLMTTRPGHRYRSLQRRQVEGDQAEDQRGGDGDRTGDADGLQAGGVSGFGDADPAANWQESGDQVTRVLTSTSWVKCASAPNACSTGPISPPGSVVLQGLRSVSR